MKRMKKLTSIGLVLAMTVGLLAGCSGGGSGNGEDASTSGGKGRYVEENWGDPLESQDDNSYSYIQTMKQLSDGTIRAIVSDSSDRGFSVKDSTDGGKTWGDASMDLSALDQLNLGDDNTDDDGNGDYAYVGSMTIDADGDLAFVYTQSHSETKDNVTSVDSTEKYYLLTKDGKLSEIAMEIPNLQKEQHYEYDSSEDETGSKTDDPADSGVSAESETEDDGVVINENGDSDNKGDTEASNGIQTLKLKDAENLYVADYNGAVYHVTTADGKIVATFDDMNYVNNMYLCGDKLLLDDYEKVYEYDTATDKKTAEHEALASVITSKGSVTIADYLKDGHTIYYSCTEGIYTYDLDKDTSEQIVDGNMSSLVSPSGNVEYLIPKDDGQIFVKFSDYTGYTSEESFLNYAYDKDAAKRPDKELTIYTLKDDYTIRTLAAAYQKAHPDVYVKVESGVSGDDAVTTSDAIRTLNTEVMGGNGPDILFMDGLPVNSYVEKGLLADVSDTVNPLISDGKLFDKIAQTYKGDDGKIYAVPMTFKVPIVIGRKSDLDKLNSLSDFATLAQDFVKDHKKNENFIESYSLYSMVGDMMYSNSASWFKEDGSLDSDSLKSYLNDIKAIYNAAYETLSDKDKSDMDQMKQYYTSDDYEMDASWYGSDPSSMAMYIMAGMNRIAYGNMSGTSSLGDLASIMRKDADINYKALPGSVQNVYVPSDVIGINAKSKNIDTAKEFYAFALSADGQKAIDSYSGFPVNKERFDASLVDPDAGTEGYDPNASKGSWGMTDEDGNEISVDIYWPTDDQIAQLKSLIDSLDTPSYGDYTILSTILKDSINAIIGDTSVDDAVEQVVKDIDIYLSE